MLIIRVTAQFSEQNIQQALNILQTLKRQTQDIEGRQEYQIYIDPENPTLVVLYQVWTSQADFDAYKSSNDFIKMGASLAPLMTAMPKTDTFKAEQVS